VLLSNFIGKMQYMENKQPPSNTPGAVEDEAFWKHHIEQYKASGSARADYCRLNKLNYHRFGYWLHKNKGTQLKESLVAVKLAAEPLSSQVLLCTLNLRCGHMLQIYEKSVLSIILEKFR
jgi:hypothetical protein